ncbi:MAG: formate dehydrogenase subunit gamma [Rhodobiaceae bacterium]|nr:formate dehydrogenase subunit gamma [Rhodobiaceae bacterium]MCC0012732.1 formate dehydrogenase subunit gamma [Rhodobiaceae bacterium]MCC0018383.1 formate dehydrogenase subunit gamma [Rhodobiaceae bacterium]MCC0051176.1 formate dehydrogenase subunit gamma [Rhodobiaceae bacterium]MCC0060241.1 formate dehydrogenase subunit gamma [Rhodobiaceae bacterium]
MSRNWISRLTGPLAVFAVLAVIAFASLAASSPAMAQSGLDPKLVQELQGGQTLQGGSVPGNVEGTSPISEQWRDVRRGLRGTVSIPDKKAGVLVQSEGENWRNMHNGPLSTYSIWVIAGMIVVLALFFLIRGRIRIEQGKSGTTITRFKDFERFGHWLLAVSFIILALSGLNLLYGRYWLLPAIGPEAFGTITLWGKFVHNYLSFAFMLGLAIILLMWAVHNIPNRYDLIWMSKAGGLFTKHSHPPARKFNAGQKVLFWLVILGGVSISLSGWSLLFPFEYPMFAKTFEILNMLGFNWILGFDLPTTLTPMQEMQFAQLWHAILAVFLIAVILGHIYIGSIGMEGAFDAMGSGEVDLNWAKEHHSIWVEEMTESDAEATKPAPAE